MNMLWGEREVVKKEGKDDRIDASHCNMLGVGILLHLFDGYVGVYFPTII